MRFMHPRVGAYMAQRIEESKGRAALVELVKQGPAQFITTYESLLPFSTQGQEPIGEPLPHIKQ
jgi:hypothetical protein